MTATITSVDHQVTLETDGTSLRVSQDASMFRVHVQAHRLRVGDYILRLRQSSAGSSDGSIIAARFFRVVE